MPRAKREQSSTGIYHVMMRGINKQNIFFCEDDYVRMMHLLHDAQFLFKGDGVMVSSNLCTIYAYCILDNHLHILIREGERGVSDIMRRIADSYAVAYNKKYERVGHLFQGRFLSEPVNDWNYFLTLIRYIHRNPVKAMECKVPEEYPYSSWNEYTGHKSNIYKVLKPGAINVVLARCPLAELSSFVNQTVDDECLDIGNAKGALADSDATDIVLSLSGCSSIEDFRQLDPETQIHFLLAASDRGVSLRQSSRIGSLSYYMLQKAYSQKQGANQSPGSDPENKEQMTLDEIQEKIRFMPGIGNKTKHNLHLIVEYLAQHPQSQCKEIAANVGLSDERTRINLVRLSNVNIVKIEGCNKSVTYTLKKQGANQSRGSDPESKEQI